MKADCAAMRISQAIASARPAPTAGPGSAAIVGLRTATSAPVSRRWRSCRSATFSSCDISSFFLSRWAPMPLTLPPAQNAVPAPVIRSAPTSGFSPQVLIMVRKAGVSVSDIALLTSGRFSVIMATRSRMTQSSSLVPVSMVISVIMFPPVCCFRRFAPRNDAINASEFLDPGSQFHFPRPRAARLLQYAPITQGNRIGIEHRVRPVGRLGANRTANAAVDDEMRDMNALRRQFARHALRQSAQREFAHRERRRLRIALDAGGCAGEQDRAMFVGQHPFCRLLRHQEAAEGADGHRLVHICGDQSDEDTARPAAGVVDDYIRRCDFALD